MEALKISESMLETAYLEGEVTGREKGMEQGMERAIIKAFLKAYQDKLSIAFITTIVSLSKSEVEGILKQKGPLWCLGIFA